MTASLFTSLSFWFFLGVGVSGISNRRTWNMNRYCSGHRPGARSAVRCDCGRHNWVSTVAGASGTVRFATLVDRCNRRRHSNWACVGTRGLGHRDRRQHVAAAQLAHRSCTSALHGGFFFRSAARSIRVDSRGRLWLGDCLVYHTERGD